MAIVLGPWQAVIAVSIALGIQAFFFGDGGILAIFANCLNMAVILPFVGYATYRLVAARSPNLSQRRVRTAGIGAYVGISVSALSVGHVGLQPILFSSNGQALYSPYGLGQATPPCWSTPVRGVDRRGRDHRPWRRVLQEAAPRLPDRPARHFCAEAVESGPAARRPLWQLASPSPRSALGPGHGGLAEGGGDPSRIFVADWGLMDWGAVVVMLVVVGVIAAVFCRSRTWSCPAA